MSEHKWPAIVCTMLIGWNGWLSLIVFGHNTKIESISNTQSNVIPPVVESSFKELREKTNGEAKSNAEALAKLTQIAIENSKDIGYIKAEITKLQEHK